MPPSSKSQTTVIKSYICHYEERTAPCTRAEYQKNKETQHTGNDSTSKPSTTSIARDKNGFALRGPPVPVSPANYDHPSHPECLRFLKEVRAWSAYQNKHRPAGSTNDLPFSGDVQYLYTVCGLNY